MRRDIAIDIHTRDFLLSPSKTNTIYAFSWIVNPFGNNNCLYGEMEIPSNMSENMLQTIGVVVAIPYTPHYKDFYIRIKKQTGNNMYSYLQNPVDNSRWFLAQAGLYGQQKKNIKASQLIEVSESLYRIVINHGIAELYNGENMDFVISNANAQNKNFMLLCVPGNCYRYPVTGVGLVRYLNGNIESSDLADVLKTEFSNDGVYVLDAEYNEKLKFLDLKLDTSNVDNE